MIVATMSGAAGTTGGRCHAWQPALAVQLLYASCISTSSPSLEPLHMYDAGITTGGGTTAIVITAAAAAGGQMDRVAVDALGQMMDSGLH